MSEYQYYEFCRINSPLSQEARKDMRSLSNRAKVTSHSASYVYNYGDFRGDPKKLLLQYFDVFFYMSKFGTVQLMFKYLTQQVELDTLKKYAIKQAITCEQHDQAVLLDVYISNEEGFGWTEGEGLLPDLLPLYDEIKAGDYQFLRLVCAIHNEFMGEKEGALDTLISDIILSSAQEAFLNTTGIEYNVTS